MNRYLLLTIIVFVLNAGCATFDAKDISIRERDGDITVRVIRSYNQGAIPGSVIQVLTESGQIQGAGKIIAGEIVGGSGDVEIEIRGTGNLGFEEY